MAFAAGLQLSSSAREQILLPFAQQLKVDDIAALAAVALATTAYITKGSLWAKPDPYRYKLFQRPQSLDNSARQVQTSRDVAERLEESAADVVILWASQSGTAERFAGRLAKELTKCLNAKSIAIDISDIDASSCSKIPQSKLAIFIASTFGEGDPSDNMHDFWSWLHQPASVSLSNLRYLAFGLGNSAYVHYNLVIDTLDQQLQIRGAKPLMPTGKADDAAGETEEHFHEWKDQVLELFQTQLGYAIHQVGWEPSIAIVPDDSLEPIDLHHGEPYVPGKVSSVQSKVYALPVVQTSELFTAGERNCLHVELDLPQADLRYRTGDHIGVWPVNPAPVVDNLIQLLGLGQTRAQPLHVKSLDDGSILVPSPTTINALFGHYLEISAPLTREHIAALATFAPNEDCKNFLTRISHDKIAYAHFLETDYLSLPRLLQMTGAGNAGWHHLPLAFVVEMLRPMQPRYYSISSAASEQPRRVALTAVVADATISHSGEKIPGLTTNYLLALKNQLENPANPSGGNTQALASDQQVLEPLHLHAHIRRSTFKLPAMASAPVVMVGAGTGVAPFRAFVQERARLKRAGRDVGATKLFFGCRHPEEDFIYKDEFLDMGNKLGSSFSMTTAFSRPSDGTRKQYVQDRIFEEADAVCNLLIDGNAYFYICGSATMARDVVAMVVKMIMARQGWDEQRTDEFCNQQRKQKRWMQDVWG